jgi:uncharacterized protein YndB with AHSA1/START domain
MTISVCPVATVKAPLEQVWQLLSEPKNFDLWWEARTQSIVPPGPAQAGQMIYARAGALGISGKITIRVDAIDAPKHQLHLTTRLPLGITMSNHLTCTQVDPVTTYISFG